MKNIKDLVVVITGASSGIGLESAKLFAAQGARLVLFARSADKLAEAEAAVKNLQAEVVALPLDVTDEADVGSFGVFH